MGEHNAALRSARERSPSRFVPGEHMTRAELAERVNAWLWTTTGRRYDLDDHLIGKWERGAVRTPTAAYRSALRAVLGVDTDADLGFSTRTGPGGSPPSAATWTRSGILHGALTTAENDLLSRRSALRAAALGGAGLLGPIAGWLEPFAHTPVAGRLGAFALAEVEAVEGLVHAFRGWRTSGAGLSRTAVVGQLADVTERLQTAPGGPLTDRVFVAAADLARIAGSMAFDQGAHRAAQTHYVTAARLAKGGDDLGFGAVALGALARLQFDLAAPDDGLAVVHLAQRGTRTRATPRLRAMLAVREAWGHAQLGDVHHFTAAIDVALEAHTGSRPADEPVSLAGFDAAELHGTIGARFRDLARHNPRHAPDAVHHLTAALRLRDPVRERNRAFDLISLGRVHLLTGEADRAAAAARSALPYLDAHRPGRLGRRLADWQRESAPFRAVSDVAALRAQIDDLTTTTTGSA